MAFIEDVKKVFINNYDKLTMPNVRYIIGQGIIAEGHKGIISFSSTLIRLRYYSMSIDIKGSKLEIALINSEELLIKGKIISMEFISNEI